jgi:hypothetical protein
MNILHADVLAEHPTAYAAGQAYAHTHPAHLTRFQHAQEAAERAYRAAGVAERGFSRATFVLVFLAGWLAGETERSAGDGE